MPARPLTPDEIAKLRGPHSCELYLAIRKPNTVYTARLSSVPSSHDKVAQISFTSGSGTLSNVVAGMSLYVGTTAGAKDLGICRIRKAPQTGTFFIGETSEVAWQSDAYLTVVDDFNIWPRHPRIVDTTVYMDYDIAYTDQHTVWYPQPNLGPHAVVWLTGATVSVQFDASRSWAFGTTSRTYSWSAPGAASISGASTATPTITYNAPGYYRVYCSVTANGRTTTGVRYVFVFSSSFPPVRQFRLTSCDGSYSDGGWGFGVEMADQAAMADVEDGALCILFARDHFGDTEGGIGAYSGRENIVAVGRIIGESIEWNRDHSIVSFNVGGLQETMKRVYMYPSGVEWSSSTGSWTNIPDLTVDKALFHLLLWRSTAHQVMDITLTGDTRLTLEASAGPGTLWEQVSEFVSQIKAAVGVDQYGCFFAFLEPQLLPSTSRSLIPIIQSIERADWENIHIERREEDETCMVDLSGVSIDSTRSATPLFSLSPGHVYKRRGEVEIVERLLLSTQSSSNQLAGLWAGMKNIEFPNITVTLPAHRVCTLFPAQYYSITISEGDTERGISYSGRLVPRSVRYHFENGALKTTIVCESESIEEPSTDGDIPKEEAIEPLPPLPPVPWPSNKIGPRNVLVFLEFGGIWFTTNFHEETPRWYSANYGLSPYLLDRIRSIVVDNGELYFTVQNYGTLTGLFYAPSVGSLITQRIDSNWMVENGYSDTDYVTAIGKFGRRNYCMAIKGDVWIGNGTSWTKSGSLGATSQALGFQRMTYCGGKLLFVYGGWGNFGKVSRILQDGTVEWTFDLSINLSHQSCGTSPVVIIKKNGANDTWLSLDNGDDGDPDTLIPITYTFVSANMPAVNGNGQRIMCGNPNTIFKSSDGGTTWVDANPGTNLASSIVHCMDSNQWIAGGRRILYTPDFGLTWFDKTSELAEATERYGVIREIIVF